MSHSFSADAFRLMAAPFTPFCPDRSLNLDAIPDYWRWLGRQGVSGIFVCGTTGESSSLTQEERMQLLERWKESAPDGLEVIAHVGDVCLSTCQRLAQHAQSIGVSGIACLAPYFFKPCNEENLVAWCREVAAAAPRMPFYYYHIPSMTGVKVRVHRFLELAESRIPTLAGIKFSHNDLEDLEACVLMSSGRYDVLFGQDEILLSVIRLGVRGAVGTTYNFAAPLYQAMYAAHRANDQARAEELQQIAAQLIDWLAQCSAIPLAAFKRLMNRVALDCGSTRPPIFDPIEEKFCEAWRHIQSSQLPQLLPQWRLSLDKAPNYGSGDQGSLPNP